MFVQPKMNFSDAFSGCFSKMLFQSAYTLHPILADHAIPILFGDMLTFSELAIVLVVVILAETIVLYGCNWRSVGQAFLAALLMNLASTLFGGIWLLFLPHDINFVVYQEQLLYSYDGFFTLLVLLISYLLSIAIEAGILGILLGIQRSNPNSRIWRASWWANTVSYLTVVLPLVIFFWAAKNR